MCRKEYELNGKPTRCPRSASESGYCALHDSTLAKDIERVKAAIEETVNSGANKLDFSDTVFYDTNELFHRTFPGFAMFNNAVFHEQALFGHAKFRRSCSFVKTTFEKEASFLGQSEFEANFKGASFLRGVDFSKADLRKGVNFNDTVFGEEGITKFEEVQFAHSPVFHSTNFLGHTSFDKCSPFVKTESFTFYQCDMSGLLLTHCPFFPDHIELLDCKWPKRYGNFGRLIVRDELTGGAASEMVRIYRKLHERYYNSSEFDNYADEFYVSLMVAKRKATRGSWAGKFANLIYSVLSRYGQSISRPLIALLVMWAVVPVILLWLGIPLEPDGETVHLGTWEEYFKTVQLNFSLSTLVRSSELRPPITSFQNTILLIETFLNALLGSFVGLGIRRRFAPKKPL